MTSPPRSGRSGQFGLPTATALVLGSIIGIGVLALPTALAPYGPIALVAFAIVTSALSLWPSHSARSPDGSRIPEVRTCTRDAFGEFAGFLNAWSYWITVWAGNAAIVVAWVGYVEVFWNTGHARVWSVVIALLGLWIPSVVDLASCRRRSTVSILAPDPVGTVWSSADAVEQE